MNVVVLQVFVSLMLVAGSIVLFVYSVRQGDHEHVDRLALAPLEDDGDRAAKMTTTTTTDAPARPVHPES